MANKATKFPIKTKSNPDVFKKIQIVLDPDKPALPPIIQDNNGNQIAQWDPATNNWKGEPGATVNDIPINSFLNSNNKSLKSKTADIINDFPDSTRRGYIANRTFTEGVKGSVNVEKGDGDNSDVNVFRGTKPGEYGSGTAPNIKLITAGNALRYPSDLSGDFLQFDIYEYEGANVITTDGLGLITQRTGALKGSIALPIQSGIVDSNAVDWKEDRMNPLKAGAASVALGALSSGEDNMGEGKSGNESLKKVFDAVKKQAEGGGLAKAIKFAAAEAATGSNLRSRFSGEVMNPNLELLFNGPTLRTFQFSFIMSARDAGEAGSIKKIINLFKKSMAVKETTSLFLKSPDIFQISYKTPSGTLHPSINKIKLAACQGCNVEYTPAGTYSTFNDAESTMTQYKLTLQFGELDPIYDKDYDDGHAIGF